MPLRWLPLLILMLVLTACGAQAAPTATPSPAPSPTVLEATATPEAPADTPTPVVQPTLPPTFTPTATVPTFTPTLLTPVVDETVQALQALPTLAACATFAEDPAQSAQSFIAGEPATIVWTPVQGAASYRFRLLDASLRPILVETTTDTRFTIAGEQLAFGQTYGWEVTPFTSIGVQMCIAVGDQLVMATG